MTDYRLEPGSFRDRTSRVFYAKDSILRGLNRPALKEWEALSHSGFFARFVREGKIIPTERIEPPEELISGSSHEWAAFLKHQTVPFVSYPYEWSFGMLQDAALLQIDLLLASLDEEMILKDSSAFNFQWIGTNPVFIDIPSFIRLSAGASWVGYRQFCQMFLYPLMLQAYKDIPFNAMFRGRLDGLEPEEFYHLMSARDLLRPGVFLHVYLHAKAQMKFADTEKDLKKDIRSAGFNREMVRNNIKGLRKIIQKLSWRRSRSEWSHYEQEHGYSDTELEAKKTFIHEVTYSRSWNVAWDLGCNTGAFSRILSGNTRYVLALDADELAIEKLYRELKNEGNTKILPLVFNLADPSPALGWRGKERKSLHGRGKPDLVICLALIHHIVISANIPLTEFVDWLAEICSSLVIEFITKDDPLVKKLLLNKDDIYDDYEIGFFEESLSAVFTIEKKVQLASGTRFLYYARS